MTFLRGSVLVIVTLALTCELVQSANDRAWNTDYDNKVCANEPTCNLTSSPNINQDRLTLRKRDCMCDFECSEYGDCCKDSQYFSAPQISAEKKTYSCPSASAYYMVVSCSSSYADANIIEKCGKALLPPDAYDTALVTPVTNLAKRTTYANAYCAVCNNENDYELWDRTLGCADAPEGYLTVKQTPAVASKIDTGSATSATPAPAASTTKASDKVSVNLHFNPGAVLGNKDAGSGYNKEIKIPSFGGLGSKLINKTIGSDTGLFGAKVSRSRRQTTDQKSQSLQFATYNSKIEEIKKLIKYDPTYQELTAQYNGKTLVCKMNFKLPSSLKNYTRPCVPNLVSDCEADTGKVCQAYTQIVYETSTKKPYRNRECALACGGVASTALTGCPQEVRAGASSLFSGSGKGGGDDAACKDGTLAAKFC